MGKVDLSSKWLLGEDPDAWVRWMLGDPGLEIEAFLSAEFQHVLRQSDVLLRVRDGAEAFLLLIELQLRYDAEMPWRMQAYAALAEEKYRLPAYPLVVSIHPIQVRRTSPGRMRECSSQMALQHPVANDQVSASHLNRKRYDG